MKSKKDHGSLIGDELIRITLETYSIEFELEGANVEIGAKFCLKNLDRIIATIDPEKQLGDISFFWPLIGKQIKATSWDDTAYLAFQSGERIEIFPVEGGYRGVIKDKKTLSFDDF